MKPLNKIALTIVKVLIAALFLMNIAAVVIILTHRWTGNSNLESFMLESPGFAAVILQNILFLLLIFAVIVVSILCRLSRRKWAIIVGIILLLAAAGMTAFYGVIFALSTFITAATAYAVLSVGATLLACFFIQRLSSSVPLEVNDTWHAFRWPIWLTLAVILVVTGFWLTDEPLDQNFHRFYTDNHRIVLDKDNAAVGLAGLDAPVGSDFMEAGVSSFKNAQVKLSSTQEKVPATEAKNKLVFVGSSEELNCWVLWLPEESEKTTPNCASEKRLNEILRSNAELLKRYWQVTHMPHFRGINPNGDLFVNINRLIAADIELKLRHGRYEDAYQEWRENYQFVTRMMGEDTDFIAKAALLVAESFSLKSAEKLIYSSKRISKTHSDELIKILQPSGLAGWNLLGVMRAEYDFLYPLTEFYSKQFWFHQNFIRNRMLYSDQAFLLAANSPPSIAKEKILAALHEHRGLKSWSYDYLKDPLNTILVRGLLLDMQNARVIDLIQPMHVRDGQQRALTLALLIKSRNMKDDEIANFLTNVGAELKNPFTSEPMKWDSKKRVIRFVIPHLSHNGGDVSMDVRL